jgi:hypothetical protein
MFMKVLETLKLYTHIYTHKCLSREKILKLKILKPFLFFGALFYLNFDEKRAVANSAIQ